MEPPRIWESMLRQVLPPGTVGRSILGDLREEHARRHARDPAEARAWYQRAPALLYHKTFGLMRGQHLNAILAKLIHHHGRDFPVFTVEYHVMPVNNGHLRAQTLEALRQFTTDGATTQHQ